MIFSLGWRARARRLVFLLLLSSIAPLSAFSQTPPPVGAAVQPVEAAQPSQPAEEGQGPPRLDAVPTGDLKSLLSTLENEGKRTELINDLRTLIAVREKEAGNGEVGESVLLTFLDQSVERLSAQLSEVGVVIRRIPEDFADTGSRLRQARIDTPWVINLLKLVGVLAAGYLGQWLTGRALAGMRQKLADPLVRGVILRLARLLARTVVDVVPIAVFAGLAYAALPFLDLPRGFRIATLDLANAHILTCLVMAAVRVALVPEAPALRFLRFGDETAGYIYIWLRRFTALGLYGYVIAASLPLLGLPRGAARAAFHVVGLALTAMAVLFVLQNRAPVAAWIRGRRPEPPTTLYRLRSLVASVWHLLALLYVIGAYIVWIAGIKGGFELIARASLLTLAIIVAARILSTAAGQLIARGFTISDALKQRLPFLESRANRYVASLQIVAQVVIGIVAFFAVLHAWNLDPLGALATDVGRGAAGSVATILLVVVLAFLVWEAAGALIEYKLASERDVARRSRLRTVLPILRGCLVTVLGVMVLFIVLSELGVNIAPLLASAGVIGIAVGLGAQSLAKDVLKGLSMLMEDSIAVGDMVTLGGQSGLVEALNIGSVQLRGFDGSVYTVPFSEVTTVINMTKDYSYAVIDAGVGYKEDVDHVMTVIEEIGEGMRNDEKFKSMILAPIEVVGVDQLADSAVIIRSRIKTQPIMQWTVAREFRRRMKKRFDELGIEIPFPQRVMHLAEALPAIEPKPHAPKPDEKKKDEG